MVSRKLQPEKTKRNSLRTINNPTKFKHEYLKVPFNYLKIATDRIKTIFTYVKKNINVSTMRNLCMYNSGLFFDVLSSSLNTKQQEFPVVSNYLEVGEVYNNLREYCRSIDTESVTPNLFIQTEMRRTARYYASQIWNWKRAFKVNTYENTLAYAKTYISKTFNAMTQRDIEIIHYLLQEECYVEDVFTLFNNIENTKYLPFFLNLLHRWFLIMPILEEFSKYIPWETLMDMRTYLLDPDQLYSILLTIFYENED